MDKWIPEVADDPPGQFFLKFGVADDPPGQFFLNPEGVNDLTWPI
jgi:hypothetical protein